MRAARFPAGEGTLQTHPRVPAGHSRGPEVLPQAWRTTPGYEATQPGSPHLRPTLWLSMHFVVWAAPPLVTMGEMSQVNGRPQ